MYYRDFKVDSFSSMYYAYTGHFKGFTFFFLALLSTVRVLLAKCTHSLNVLASGSESSIYLLYIPSLVYKHTIRAIKKHTN